MSSCFLCDCSYVFKYGAGYADSYQIAYREGSFSEQVKKLMKQLPIMVGSSGTDVDDQQHKNNKKQNYVSYRVKKLEFCCSYSGESGDEGSVHLPDYVLIFKVPFREPVFDYYFTVMQNFMLFSEPECVLDYKVLQPRQGAEYNFEYPRKFNINIYKPFIVGPNDYVGVLYMFYVPTHADFFVNASARVWFDVV